MCDGCGPRTVAVARPGDAEGDVDLDPVKSCVDASEAVAPAATTTSTVGVNLDATFYCMKYEIPLMLASGGGSIVNNSSKAGLRGLPAGALGHWLAAAGAHAPAIGGIHQRAQ